jgi:hypothetical protein
MLGILHEAPPDSILDHKWAIWLEGIGKSDSSKWSLMKIAMAESIEVVRNHADNELGIKAIFMLKALLLKLL